MSEPDLMTLPKAELHVHVEGTLEPEMVFELAERNNIKLPWASLAELKTKYTFTDLESFLQLYYACCVVLRSAQDFEDLAMAYFDKVSQQGVRHVDMFFDPQAHTSRGVELDDVIDGLLAGFKRAEGKYGITGGLIMCIVRDRPVDEAMETIEAIGDRWDELVGIGVDSDEVGYPPELFTKHFARAKELGAKHFCCHAGEEGPAPYIWQAIDDLVVQRVDHAVHSVDDEKLVQRLADDKVPLTVCPFSNVRLCVVPTLAEHPLPRMITAGQYCTINSDDPAYVKLPPYGGYVGDNYVGCHEELNLSYEQLADLARNSVSGSFAEGARKELLLKEIDNWVAENL